MNVSRCLTINIMFMLMLYVYCIRLEFDNHGFILQKSKVHFYIFCHYYSASISLSLYAPPPSMILGSGPPLKVTSVAVVLFQVGNDPIAVMTVTPPINQTRLCVRFCACLCVCVCVYVCVCASWLADSINSYENSGAKPLWLGRSTYGTSGCCVSNRFTSARGR